MTDEERKQEGAEEEIEDLDAPAKAAEEVKGGQAEFTTTVEPTPVQPGLARPQRPVFRQGASGRGSCG